MNFGAKPPLVSLYVFSLLGQRIYGKNKHADFMKEKKPSTNRINNSRIPMGQLSVKTKEPTQRKYEKSAC